MMTNHGPWPERRLPDTRPNDEELAQEFGLTLHPEFCRDPQPGERTVIAGEDLNSGHSILAGPPTVRYVVTNTCCSLDAEHGEWLIRLPDKMIDARTRQKPQGQGFAHAQEARVSLGADSEGRVVVIADSGFIGTQGTRSPGPGLSDERDNLRFVLNCVRWLGHILD